MIENKLKGEAQMTRWLVGAVLGAAPLLLYPLAAAAQPSPVAFACEYGPNFSYVIVKNLSPKLANCEWDCIYQMPSGAYHANRGARLLRAGQELGMSKTKKVAPGLDRRGGGYAACT